MGVFSKLTDNFCRPSSFTKEVNITLKIIVPVPINDKSELQARNNLLERTSVKKKETLTLS